MGAPFQTFDHLVPGADQSIPKAHNYQDNQQLEATTGR
jgi:hypothetical protein